jgi:SAM-dependent methyltransferase
MTEPAAIGCIVCDGTDVELFLDLGRTALANKFLAADELDGEEPTFPLRVGFCRGCAHVQLLDRVPPSAMFDDYLYVSGASQTLRDHFAEVSDTLVGRHGLGADDLVVDIGCNDASLLDAFRGYGVRTLGVDPAANLAERARDLGIDRYTGFFGASTSAEIRERWGQASLITATNTFPHIPDLRDFMVGIEELLAPDGTFVVEAHYLVDMLEQVAFDTIYHEHVSYWALGPLLRLLEGTGLEAVRAERLPIHHGQLRVSMRHRGTGPIHESVGAVLDAERRLGLEDLATFERFAAAADGIRTDLRTLLGKLKADGKRVAAYGAPAKGSTLLEYLQIGPDDISWIADRSNLKQGRFTPGSHIPVVHPDHMLDEQPDFVLLLAWNFADEIVDQQAEYVARGGRFIVPVPEVRVL